MNRQLLIALVCGGISVWLPTPADAQKTGTGPVSHSETAGGISGMHSAPLLLYASFDRGVDADLAGGNDQGLFNGQKYGFDWNRAELSHKDPLLKLAPGIRGNGLLTGRDGQVVYYQTKGNLDPAAWTITFWVKALPEQDYLATDVGHVQMFEIQGGGWTRFYRYDTRPHLWLLNSRSSADKRQVTETLNLTQRFDVGVWHFLAVSYGRATGISIYLDGRLTARDASMRPVSAPQWLRVGQSFGGTQRPNRVIDELRVYGAALAESDVMHRYLQEGGLQTRQHARVGATGQPIEIDGKLEPGEWAWATTINGFIDCTGAVAAATPTRVLITYDKQYLYLAFHSQVPQDAKDAPETRLLHGILKSTTLDHDGDIEQDDSFGVRLIPRYPKGRTYCLDVNGVKTTCESTVTPDGRVDLRWDPKWEIESRVDMDGWTVESRLPLSELGVQSIRPGEQWRCQFLRRWRRLKQAVDVWECHAGPREQRGQGLGTVLFAGDANVAVRVARLDVLKDGRAEVEVDLRNAAPTARSVSATLKAGDTSLAAEQYRLAAGGADKFVARADLRPLDAQLLRLEITDGQSQPVYRQTVPFYLPQRLALLLKSYPSKKLLTVSWQLPRMTERAGGLGATVEILREQKGPPVHTHRLLPLPALFGSTPIDVSKVPDGRYAVRMTITEGEKQLYSQTAEYEKRPLPVWVGNTLGISDKVPAPWTAVVVAEDTVSLWGRTYDFGGKLLPARIVNQSRPLLARPMTLRVKTAAGEADSASAMAEVTWEERSPARAQSSRQQTLADLVVTNRVRLEFDGFTWLELQVAPAGKSAAVEEITLAIPVNKRFAHLINAHDYSLRTTGKLPAQGYASPMGPRWIGDEQGGIQVFAEHSANWVVADRRRELTVSNGPDEVVIELHLVSKRFELTRARTFALGFTVTPVKPAEPRLRDILSMSARTVPLLRGTEAVGEYLRKAAEAHHGLEVFHLWSQGWWQTAGMAKTNPDHLAFYPLPRPDLSPGYGEITTDYGVVVHMAPYARLSETWAASPEFAQFRDEWLLNIKGTHVPNESIPEPMRQARVCQSSGSYRDFYLWAINQLLQRTKAKALYFDVSKPQHCNNIHHGCGFVGDDGELVTTCNILGTRQLLRRIYTLLREKHPDGLIFFHMSGQVNMAVWSFADALVDGENTVALLDRKENRGYERVLTLEQFAAEYAAQNNFGPYSVVLPQFSRSGAIRAEEWSELGYQHAEYLLGLIFLHNSQLWYPAYLPTEPTNKLYLAFDENGLTADWSFLGYWRQHAARLPDDVKASFYLAPDRRKALMAIMNLRWEDVTIDVPLDASVLGMQSLSSLRPLYHKSLPGRLEDGTIVGSRVTGKNFRVFLLE